VPLKAATTTKMTRDSYTSCGARETLQLLQRGTVGVFRYICAAVAPGTWRRRQRAIDIWGHRARAKQHTIDEVAACVGGGDERTSLWISAKTLFPGPPTDKNTLCATLILLMRRILIPQMLL